MPRPRKNQEEVVGQDSFLDIIANLVGIMIILVMVVGARAKDALVVAGMKAPQTPAEVTRAAEEAAAAKTIADQVEADFRRIAAQIQEQNVELMYRQEERNRVQTLVVAAERAIAEQRKQLDDSQRQALDQQQAVSMAQSELRDLQRTLGQVEQSLPQTAILEHLPTPMAKTVFGQEVHLRLHGGRVAFVPWDEFIAKLKEDAPRKVSRLRDVPEFTDTIGPAGGFWMRYTLRRENQAIPGKTGVAMQQMVTLERFVLLPESEDLGEPVEEALRSGSMLDTVLSQYRPQATTITIWTYPDSFREFRQLKRALFERGFVSAARPLPADHPIGGSPEGSRSAAQ